MVALSNVVSYLESNWLLSIILATQCASSWNSFSIILQILRKLGFTHPDIKISRIWKLCKDLDNNSTSLYQFRICFIFPLHHIWIMSFLKLCRCPNPKFFLAARRRRHILSTLPVTQSSYLSLYRINTMSSWLSNDFDSFMNIVIGRISVALMTNHETAIIAVYGFVLCIINLKISWASNYIRRHRKRTQEI